MSERRWIIEVKWKDPKPDNDFHTRFLTEQIANRITKNTAMYDIYIYPKPPHWENY